MLWSSRKTQSFRSNTPQIHQNITNFITLTKQKWNSLSPADVCVLWTCTLNWLCCSKKYLQDSTESCCSSCTWQWWRRHGHTGNKSSTVFSFLLTYCRNLKKCNRFWDMYQKTEPVLPPCPKMRKYVVPVRRDDKLNHPLTSAWSITCKGSCKQTLKCWITE